MKHPTPHVAATAVRMTEFSLIGGGAFYTLHPLCELNGPQAKAPSVERRRAKRRRECPFEKGMQLASWVQ